MKRKLCALTLTLAFVLALMVPAGASGQRTVHAGTPEELKAALQSNTTIILEGKDYDVELLILENLENVTIQGTEKTRLITNSINEVVVIDSCENITLKGLDICQETPVGICAVTLSVSTVRIEDCDLYGSGDMAFNGCETTLTVDNSVIRDFPTCMMFLSEVTAVFNGCTFSGNGHGGNNSVAVHLDNWSGTEWPAEVTFNSCTFKDNNTATFVKISDSAKGDPNITYTVNNCTFSGNAWKEPTGNVGPQPTAPAANTAYASTQEIEVDGNKVTFEAYALKDANGNDTNYIKLRDVASVLNGTAAQFEVGWNGSVTITTGQPYTPNGSEMSTPYSGDRAYQDASAATLVNGSPVQLSAILLTDDNGNGYTYYKLRDLGEALGFTVDWSAERGIFIETN